MSSSQLSHQKPILTKLQQRIAQIDAIPKQNSIKLPSKLPLQIREIVELQLEHLKKPKLSFQKVPKVQDCLTDTYGRRHSYLRISLVDHCNLACTYCMPEEGPPTTKTLDTQHALKLADFFIENGVDKIRFTGGEPTLHPGLTTLIQKVKERHPHVHVGLTTNGVLLGTGEVEDILEPLSSFPDIPKDTKLPSGLKRLLALKAAGMDSINISLDTLDPQKFAQLTRRSPQTLLNVLKSIVWSTHLFSNTKVNVVVERSRLEDWYTLVQLTKKWPIQVRAIEFMPFHGNKYSLSSLVSRKELEQGLIGWNAFTTPSSETAQVYTHLDYVGSLGIVSSMTNPFCSGCNRVRITSDGRLKVCLHGEDEVDLLPHLDNPEILKSVVDKALKGKFAKHAGVELLSKKSFATGRPMVSIGGMHTYHVGRLGRSFEKIGNGLFGSSRLYSTKLSHVQGDEISMVDISEKKDTIRRATAKSTIYISPEAVEIVKQGGNKGNVLITAKIAATSAVKRTWDVVPLCHPIPITHISVDFSNFGQERDGRIPLQVLCTVSSQGKTGVEMEALHGVMIASLTVYDMLKAIDKGISFEMGVISKEGGKSGSWSQ